MKLYIAEKPSLGRAIADVLPRPHIKGEGCIRVGSGDVVSWCIGHLLELAEPEAYNPEYKRWSLAHLPIVPEQWQLQPKNQTRKQLTVLRKLVKEATVIVHAGDPDREGQLLVDQALHYLGVSGRKLDGIERLLINDLNPEAVKRSLAQLRSNKAFHNLSCSALARSRADWLYGMNMTRAYTLHGRQAGLGALLSVGRVQTPVLGLVVRRQREIAAFTAKPFFEVLAVLEAVGGSELTAKWLPSEACGPYMDEEGRVLSKALADNVARRITGQPATVTSVQKNSKSQSPPLPCSLSFLQIQAAKRFGLNAQQVLDICQALYERHKLITYPRSDSRHIPVEHYQQRKAILQAVASNSLLYSGAVASADDAIRTRAWDDSKIEAHHAIIPTAKKAGQGKLSVVEQQVYDLVAQYYVCQFYPKWQYVDAQVVFLIAGGKFLIKARKTERPGWKVLFTAGSEDKKNDDQQDDFTQVNNLPNLTKGQVLPCLRGEVVSKETQPPKPFTDATLLAAMTGINRFVQDLDIKKILKESDGLGTEATRAGIIELLFKRQYLIRQGKQILATATGCALIDSLPPTATLPDMTAHWESQLDSIAKGEKGYSGFMQALVDNLARLIQSSKVILPPNFVAGSKPNNNFKKRRTSKPRKQKA